MKQIVINFLKYNRIAYAIYYYVMSFLMRVLRIFIRTNDKLILFNSFAGRKFDDSPRAIYDIMCNDIRFDGCKLIWAFHNPEQYKDINKIKTDGLEYFKTAIAARVWITNSSVERGLSFTGKHTLYFNTWHGTPVKKMGTDIEKDNTSFVSKSKVNFDVMMSQGHFDTEVFSRSFGIPKYRFLEVGLPRNDILAKYTEDYRSGIRKALNVSEDKIIILYMPTFREYEKDENLGVVAAPPIDIVKWERELSDCVLFFRAHYEVSKVMEIKESQFLRNMTDYPEINDLLIAADILISDYSSVFFDFSITGKVMLHFTYDYDKYSSKRGMYFDIRDYLSGGATEDSIIDLIKTIDINKEKEKTITFRTKYVNFYGDAAQKAVDYIAKELGL